MIPKAVIAVFSVLSLGTLMVVFLSRFGFLDELDFWAGTLGLVLFGAIEMIVFSWIFGIEKGWSEMQKGADLQIPGFFKFILKYIICCVGTTVSVRQSFRFAPTHSCNSFLFSKEFLMRRWLRMRWERNDWGGFDHRPMLDEVSTVLGPFPPMETGLKRIEESRWAQAIHPLHLFRLIHANGQMDCFDMGAVDFNDSLSEWQIRFENSSDSRHCQISRMSLSSPPVADAKG
jgi:hypothetical protein